jgi:hypothetical protein
MQKLGHLILDVSWITSNWLPHNIHSNVAFINLGLMVEHLIKIPFDQIKLSIFLALSPLKSINNGHFLSLVVTLTK